MLKQLQDDRIADIGEWLSTFARAKAPWFHIKIWQLLIYENILGICKLNMNTRRLSMILHNTATSLFLTLSLLFSLICTTGSVNCIVSNQTSISDSYQKPLLAFRNLPGKNSSFITWIFPFTKFNYFREFARLTISLIKTIYHISVIISKHNSQWTYKNTQDGHTNHTVS